MTKRSALSFINGWLERLQANGYRLTEPRRAVVETVAGSERILSPTEIYDLARSRCTSLGLVTVYRTLAKLEELGLVQRVHRPGDCHAYIASGKGHQHLLICQACGKAQYFDGDTLDGLMAQVSNRSGYRIQDHWLQLFGLCNDCQKVQSGGSD